TFFVSVFLLLMQFLWKYIDDLVGKGLEWNVILELMFYASSTFIPMALPLAILLSSIMTFGNLGEHYELVALKSAGISLPRIMRPLIILSVIISIMAFWFSNYVMPVANLKMRSLLYDVRHIRPEINIKEGIFYNGIEGYSIRISKKDRNTKMLYDIKIYDQTKRQGNLNVTVADSGFMKLSEDEKFLMMNLYNGQRYDEVSEEGVRNDEKKFPFRRDKFIEQSILFELEGVGLQRTDEDLFKDHYEMLNVQQLTVTIDSLNQSIEKKQTDFGVTMYKSNYFKREDPRIKSDTVKNTYNLDSLLLSLNKADRAKVYSLAADFIRGSKSYVTTIREDIKSRREWVSRHDVEWHRKFTLSFACLVLFFIGAPLGAIIRKGGIGMPVVVSIIFFIVYYLLSIMGEKFSREGVIPVYYGMWLSSVVLFPFGVFLTYKAATDSAIMNTDTYVIIFKKLKYFLKKKPN
ncbi:MAG: permease, partial [Bacteroidetes bacterium GWA2_30_7]